MRTWLIAGFAGFILTAGSAVAQTSATRTCEYDPNLGVPNPLGMRSYVKIMEVDGDTTFIFEQFPAPVAGAAVPVTLASMRAMTFYGTPLEQARQLMLQNPDYYAELVGYPDADGFEAVNAVITCTP